MQVLPSYARIRVVACQGRVAPVMVKSTDRTANSVMFSSNLWCLFTVSVMSRGQSLSELWGQFLSCGHRSGSRLNQGIDECFSIDFFSVEV
jgi:hypothetical protein